MSVLWIIFGHRIFNQMSFPISNQLAVTHHFTKLYSVLYSTNNLAVDTFFVMGGLLATISTLNALEQKKLNVIRMMFHRYLRYTPVLAALILYIVSISKFDFKGPIQADYVRTNCIDNWWTALLHVQNYVNPHSQCASHSWYLSADFQLFILTPLLIIPVWKIGRKSWLALPFLALMPTIYILVLSYVKDLRVKPASLEAAQISGKWIYYATHARAGPWLFGMTLGYILFKYRNKKIEINKTLNAILWITSIATLTTIVLLALPLNKQNNETKIGFNAFYLAFHRITWAYEICWIIFACQKLKSGGFIRWFLCLPQWQPIARMSLSMYLVHPIYIFVTLLNQKDALLFEIWPMVRKLERF